MCQPNEHSTELSRAAQNGVLSTAFIDFDLDPGESCREKNARAQPRSMRVAMKQSKIIVFFVWLSSGTGWAQKPQG
jgi:hypothetical protein